MKSSSPDATPPQALPTPQPCSEIHSRSLSPPFFLPPPASLGSIIAIRSLSCQIPKQKQDAEAMRPRTYGTSRLDARGEGHGGRTCGAGGCPGQANTPRPPEALLWQPAACVP